MKNDDLKKHIYQTYVMLRLVLVILAVLFPTFLYLVGRLYGVPPQSSISAYYFASIQPGGEPLMRVWFVGILFAIGVCLIIYRGFSDLENYLLDFAGIFAILVVLFPMPWNCEPNCPTITVHGVFAVLLFLCIGAVSIWCPKKSLNYLEDEEVRRSYAIKYRVIGALMLASPLLAFFFTALLDERPKFVFFIEAFGIYVFAYYWWTKGKELGQSNAELRALQSEIET